MREVKSEAIQPIPYSLFSRPQPIFLYIYVANSLVMHVSSAFAYMYSAILTCLSMQQLHFDRTHTAEQDSQAERQVEQTQSECREII